MNLELMAMVWLRCERRCEIVLRERSPRSGYCGQPDVIGVTSNRFLIEVEIKRSMSDFRADLQKNSRGTRDLYPEKQARQFYYFCRESLAEKVQSELPAWAGLLYVQDDGPQRPYVRVKAPLNKASARLSVKECCRLVHMLTNHLLASETRLDGECGRWRHAKELLDGWICNHHLMAIVLSLHVTYLPSVGSCFAASFGAVYPRQTS